MTTKPDFEKLEEYQNRLRKLEEIRSLDIDPYPHTFLPTHHAALLQKEFAAQELGHSEDAAAGETPLVVVSGRLVLFRAMGKNAFAQLQDHTGRIQVMFNRDQTELSGYNPQNPNDPKPFKVIEKKFDLGDIIGIEGNLFFTQKGELTIYAQKVTLLCKTLLPLADKHSGLADKEIRYRKRWLDLITHDDVRITFRRRSKIVSMIRNYFEDQDFIEVETPVLQSIYGGAEARPFVTKLHALDQEMFMRISLEIPLKKLVVGGMNKVFEIGKVFRNEGIDRTHNPEFTLLEAYSAYWDYHDMMRTMENLVEALALELHGTTRLRVIDPETENESEIDVKTPWKRLTMKESLIQYAHIDVDTLSDEELYKRVLECGHLETKKVKTFPRGLMINALFEHLVEPQLIQPHHITDFPIETTPLCKPHRDRSERGKGVVERFESFILGGEFCNAYTELNDPMIQYQLLNEQAERKASGDEEASPFDHEFVEAIYQGMPPTGGIGIGIDRLVMLLTHSSSIRDVLYFPWMKPSSHTD